MSLRRALTVAGCLLAFQHFSAAQQNKLIVHPPEKLTAKRGAPVVAKINVAILPGFHVNSDKPKDEFLIPLKLTWNSGPLEAKQTMYPKPEEITVGDQTAVVFTGNFDLQTKFLAPTTAPPGSAEMTGKLRYQACNNQMCFRPTTVEVHLPVNIE